MISYVFQGAAAPDALVIEITPSESLPDLSTVTGGHIEVYRRRGGETDWDFTIESQSATLLTIKHEFAGDGSDVPDVDKLRLIIYLDLPVGGRVCVPVLLDVRKL